MFVVRKIRGLFRSWALLGFLLLTALIGFEFANFITTQNGLKSLFPGQVFLTLPLATWLAVAACLSDFAGLARMFTPQQNGEPAVVWIAVWGWFMAATINAALTWYDLALIIRVPSTIPNAALVAVWAPVAIAVFVWLMRIALIGGISLAGERFFWGSGSTGYADYFGNGGSYKPQPPLHKPKPLFHPVDDYTASNGVENGYNNGKVKPSTLKRY